MGTDWNQKKFSYEGSVLSWDEKDDIQRLLTVLQNDAVDTLNTVLEYGFVMCFTTEHLDFVNRASHFWSEVMRSLRFTLIMKSARLFDESADAIGLNKVLNILEQSVYRSEMTNELKEIRKQYGGYQKYINEIRTIRDKVYAHNDKKEYRFWKYNETGDLEFEGEFWNKLEEMLMWVRDSLASLRVLIGDGYPVNTEITNDLEGLLPHWTRKERVET